MTKYGCTLLMVLCSCSLKAGLNGVTGSSGTSGAQAASNGKLTMPDIMFVPEAKARAALKAAGHTGSVMIGQGACGSVREDRIVEMGVICQQSPVAGRVQSVRLPVSILVQTQDPRHGRVGKHGEWHLMPAVVGMPLEKAMTTLAAAGLTNTETIGVRRVTVAGCKPNYVCSTYPEAKNRSGQGSTKFLSVGADPNATPKVVETKPENDENSEKEDSKDDEAKEKEEKAEDFF